MSKLHTGGLSLSLFLLGLGGLAACTSEGASAPVDSDSFADAHGDASPPDASLPDDVLPDTALLDAADSTGPTDAVESDGATDAADGHGDVAADVADGGIGPIGTWEQVFPPNIKKEHVFKGLWNGGPADVFLAGVDGVLVRGTTEAWTILSEGEWPNFNGIWGFGPDDAWAVGMGGVLSHWNGSSWQVPSGCSKDADCEDNDPCTEDACGDSGICVRVPTSLPGCCGGVAYEAGFDGGTLEGWTITDLYAADPGNGGIVWNVFGFVGTDGKPRYTSPPAALYFGIPNKPCVDDPASVCPDFDNQTIVGSKATSPPIAIPQSVSVTLSFQVFVDTESGPSFDALAVNVLVNGLPTLIWTKDAVGKAFVPVDVDLSAYSGQTIQLELVFDSKDSFANTGEGVFIDDIVIDTECGEPEAKGLVLPTLFDVWGAAPDDVYAVGVVGTVAHFDGDAWKQVEMGGGDEPWAIRDIIGVGDELLASGQKGLVLHTTGGSFAVESVPVTTDVHAVWGSSNEDLYAVTDKGVVLHSTGAGWTQKTVFGVGDLKGVYGSGPDNVIAVGTKGTILRKVDGGEWIAEPTGLKDDLEAVWAMGDEAFAVGVGGLVLHYVGGVWTPEAVPTTQDISAIFGTSTDEVWAAGKNGIILRYDGMAWEDRSNPLPVDYYDIFVVSKDDVWLVGDAGTLVHWNGDEYSQVETPTGDLPIFTIWGRSATDIFAAGDGFVLHWDGTSWRVAASGGTSANLRGVCGSGPDNVIAVGVGGTILRYDGANWAIQPIKPIEYEDGTTAPITAELHGCYALSPSVAFAVGADGTILHFDGSVWDRGPTQSPASLRSVYAISEDRAFTVGIEGTILSWDGQQWTPLFSGSVATLYDIHGTGYDNIVAVGDIGTILRFVANPKAVEKDMGSE